MKTLFDIGIGIHQHTLFAAEGYDKLRVVAKAYLSDYGKNYDKFTVTPDDSFLGYVTEYLLKKYLDRRFGSVGLSVKSWDDDFDISRIWHIVGKNSSDEEDVNYVKEWFYDKYDLKLIYEDRFIYIDVKTAKTEREPVLSWEYLYPVIQQKKAGKDYIVLCYYVVNSVENRDDCNKFIIAGYMSEDNVSKYHIVPAGDKTKRGTVSQVDNFEIPVSDFEPIDALVCRFLLQGCDSNADQSVASVYGQLNSQPFYHDLNTTQCYYVRRHKENHNNCISTTKLYLTQEAAQADGLHACKFCFP